MSDATLRSDLVPQRTPSACAEKWLKIACGALHAGARYRSYVHAEHAPEGQTRASACFCFVFFVVVAVTAYIGMAYIVMGLYSYGPT